MWFSEKQQTRRTFNSIQASGSRFTLTRGLLIGWLLAPGVFGVAQAQNSSGQKPAQPVSSSAINGQINCCRPSSGAGGQRGITQVQSTGPRNGPVRFDSQGRVLPPVGNWPNQAQSPGFRELEYLELQAQLSSQAHNGDAAMQRMKLAEEEQQLLPQSGATPDAPDQSDLLKNSKDPDFILRNFRTMWVDARAAQYFGSDQMKAALGRNKDFLTLNIRIVDDPKVADVLLRVGYTFAWDFPFQLKHQNTSIVLLAGKGEGPFSGPLGAADVARQFVKMAKHYRASPGKYQK